MENTLIAAILAIGLNAFGQSSSSNIVNRRIIQPYVPYVMATQHVTFIVEPIYTTNSEIVSTEFTTQRLKELDDCVEVKLFGVGILPKVIGAKNKVVDTVTKVDRIVFTNGTQVVYIPIATNKIMILPSRIVEVK